MNNQLKQYALRFDAQTLRERALLAITLIVAITFVWWVYFADPRMKSIERLQTETRNLSTSVASTRATIAGSRQRIRNCVSWVSFSWCTPLRMRWRMPAIGKTSRLLV